MKVWDFGATESWELACYLELGYGFGGIH